MAKKSHQNLTSTMFVCVRLEPGSRKKAMLSSVSLLALHIVCNCKVIWSLKVFQTCLRTV